MKSYFIFSAVLLILFISCGKDDKEQEFVDDKTVPTEQKKSDEVKQELPKDTSFVKKDTSSANNYDSKYKERHPFEYEKPVAVVSPLEAENYNGRTVTVRGFVADVYKSEKVAYLNFVEKFPNNPFTAVIFARKFSDFPEIDKYKLKDVEVTGRVSMFKGRAQIILESPLQIKLLN
ncbi:MAG: hypothetical protein L0Y79_04350 [Chlorobi bacterium]|nr:hypothetical protein [Chlorobiota bacterium]MCI0716346.1 hypothetical protein [Chlorobiota bacterium]